MYIYKKRIVYLVALPIAGAVSFIDLIFALHEVQGCIWLSLGSVKKNLKCYYIFL